MSLPPASDAPLKVFIVEDNEDTRFLLAQLIELNGCEVHSAGSLQSALHDPHCLHSDVLISDLGLPDGTGWDLLRSLRRAGSNPYAIAMSGFGTLTDKAASADTGYRHHLVKPVQLDALERLLEEARHEIGGAP